MDKSLSNDGVEFSGESGEYDPYTKFATEQACEATLSNLALTSPGRFDFAVIDGNHDAAYLRRETAIMRELLRPGGVLILDDVSDAWADIKAEYAAMESAAWRTVGADGRVGVLQAA
jgi:predicted O-methyltransferase YrrM